MLVLRGSKLSQAAPAGELDLADAAAVGAGEGAG
jgi:hypothetical protein